MDVKLQREFLPADKWGKRYLVIMHNITWPGHVSAKTKSVNHRHTIMHDVYIGVFVILSDKQFHNVISSIIWVELTWNISYVQFGSSFLVVGCILHCDSFFFMLVLKVMLKKGHLTLFVTCLFLSVSRTVCLSAYLTNWLTDSLRCLLEKDWINPKLTDWVTYCCGCL